MKKSKKIFFLIIIFLIISTYHPKNSEFSIPLLKNYFGIKFIKVENNFLIDKNEIKLELASIYDKNIFFLNKAKIDSLLKNIYLVESFDIKKIFPNKIIIKINEETPVAILNRKKEKFFITKKNNLIKFKKNLINKNLPYVFGDDAEIQFSKFNKILKENGFPLNLIKNYYFFKINRWDLHLLDQKIIRFPSNGLNQSVKKVVSLLQKDEFKKFNVIDLRINGKMIVQ